MWRLLKGDQHVSMSVSCICRLQEVVSGCEAFSVTPPVMMCFEEERTLTIVWEIPRVRWRDYGSEAKVSEVKTFSALRIIAYWFCFHSCNETAVLWALQKCTLTHYKVTKTLQVCFLATCTSHCRFEKHLVESTKEWGVKSCNCTMLNIAGEV